MILYKTITMPKSSKRKPSIQRDSAGNPFKKKNIEHIKRARYKQMMRVERIYAACDSLTAAEVDVAIKAGKGYMLEYISTILDENGVPVSGDSESIRICNGDIDLLKSVYVEKRRSEDATKEKAIA